MYTTLIGQDVYFLKNYKSKTSKQIHKHSFYLQGKRLKLQKRLKKFGDVLQLKLTNLKTIKSIIQIWFYKIQRSNRKLKEQSHVHLIPVVCDAGIVARRLVELKQVNHGVSEFVNNL